jgi:hypothetical protein
MNKPTITWSDWVEFAPDRSTFSAFPTTAGVYRVRVIGDDGLVYIGQTGRSLRERVRTLCLRTLDTEMPFNDPHTAAPNLWAWRRTEGWEYEASVAEVDLSDRQALECWLLWQYRLETGESTLANHGRFHPRFSKSGSRKNAYRGERLNEPNPAGGQSLPPLRAKGHPTAADWMGLDWQGVVPLASENVSDAPPSPGLYRIIQDGQVVYVGETGNLRARLIIHSANWQVAAHCSWVETPDASLAYQRHELENDLIAMCYAVDGHSPRRQFGRTSG